MDLARELLFEILSQNNPDKSLVFRDDALRVITKRNQQKVLKINL